MSLNIIPNPSRVESPQQCARIVGILLLISLVAGIYGEIFIQSKLIVSSDAATTARNLVAMEHLFRLGFAAYLMEAVCDVILSLCFYVLLKPVGRNLALLAAFFGLASTVTFCTAQLIYFGTSLVLGGPDYLKTFTPDQLDSIVLLMVKISGMGSGLFMVFYGIAAMIRGYLMYHSGYLPKFLGVAFWVAGLGFVIRNILLVLAPEHASILLLPPMLLAMLSAALWLLTKGISRVAWEKSGG